MQLINFSNNYLGMIQKPATMILKIESRLMSLRNLESTYALLNIFIRIHHIGAIF